LSGAVTIVDSTFTFQVKILKATDETRPGGWWW